MLHSVAPFVILTKSLIPFFATDVRFRFDAAVATAGLLSYIGLVSFIWWPQKMAGNGFDCSRRGTAVAEGPLETADHLRQGIAMPQAGRPIAGSSLVRRLVLAKDDPAKLRIRAWLSDIDDERLFCFGLTSEDIAALRGAASPTAAANLAQRLDEPSENGGALLISPPIACVLYATDDVRRDESTTPRREGDRKSVV